MSSTSLRIGARLAIAFGVFLILGETRRNWGAWGHWASYAFDYLFAVGLWVFGLLALRGKAWARALLLTTWALTVALFSLSFYGHVRSLDQPTYGPIPHLRLTVIIGVLDAIALAGLVLVAASFVERRRAAQSALP